MADRDPWETAPAASAAAERDPWEKPVAQSQGGMSWADVGKGFVTNFPSTAVEAGKNIVQPFLHPIDTATAIKDVGQGALQKVGVLSGEDKKSHADAFGQFFADRYGGMENLKKTMATDPAGFLLDLSMILSGGESALGRVPGLVGETAKVVGKVGSAVDPIANVGRAAKGAGYLGSELMGLGTGIGGKSIREIATGGFEGGEAAKDVASHMRQTAPASEIVDDAFKARGVLIQRRGAEYQEGIKDIKNITKPLPFDKIDDALIDIANVKTYQPKGGGPPISMNPKTQAIREEIADWVQKWRALGPADHTPEGLDALKQIIGEVREGTEYGTPARHVADQAYHAVRQTIVDGSPQYAKVMKAYEESSDLIKEIESTLSVNPNATVDTTLRKLQSVLRNNVSTNYGQRQVLADYLVNAGAPNLMKKLAGQQASSLEPRGLAKLVAQGIFGGAVAAETMGAHGASTLGALPFLSPRAMGETALAAGKVGRGISKLVPHPKATARGAFQTGRIEDYLRKKGMVQ